MKSQKNWEDKVLHDKYIIRTKEADVDQHKITSVAEEHQVESWDRRKA